MIARRSRCVRDSVGAVVVDPRNRLVASGYNGPPGGWWPRDVTPRIEVRLTWDRPPRREYSNIHDDSCTTFCPRGGKIEGDVTYGEPVPLERRPCVAIHAEANALLVGDRTTREGGTIYTTSDVCFGCAKLIANSGVVRVVVARTTVAEHRNPGTSYEFLRESGLEVIVLDV